MQNQFYISNLAYYKENNRLEAKRSQKGLPVSVWETYSAFANTDGGVILLGVEESDEHELSVCGVDDARGIVSDFWNTVNNTQKVSTNILTERMVRIETVDGKDIVVIEVPRAERSVRPVYLNRNPEAGTYRRNFEGDYHCTKEQLSSIFRDASETTADTKVLSGMDMTVFCVQTVKDYRARFKSFHSNHVWNSCDDEQFLRNIGALSISDVDNRFHPTVAGLLMFGYEYEILRELPMYFLDYRECFETSSRWTHRLVSSSGDWSGNLYDFFWLVYPRLRNTLSTPFAVSDGVDRIDETHSHLAIREFLLNTIVHSDHYGRRGIVVNNSYSTISFSNPGDMRVGLNVALSGGVSDPRNYLLMKMFSLVNIGERAGSGMPDAIFAMRSELNAEVRYNIVLDPDRTETTITMPSIQDSVQRLHKNCTDSAQTLHSDCTDPAQKEDAQADSLGDTERKILKLLSADKTVTTAEIAIRLGLSRRTIATKIKKLQDIGVVSRVGPDNGGYWIVK